MTHIIAEMNSLTAYITLSHNIYPPLHYISILKRNNDSLTLKSILCKIFFYLMANY